MSAHVSPASGAGSRGVNVYKLITGVVITAVVLGAVPVLLARIGWMPPFSSNNLLAVVIAGIGLLIKHLVSDLAGGEFSFNKYGHDCCLLTFGAALTALAAQMITDVDLYPGMNAFSPLAFVSDIVPDPADARRMQILLVFLAALLGTLLTAVFSAKIKRREAKGEALLSLFSCLVGVPFLGCYALILVAKG